MFSFPRKSFLRSRYHTEADSSPRPRRCGASQTNITRDIHLLSQLTNKLRLYGANCNQTALVLQAIEDSGVDMSVYVAIYVDSNETAFEDQVKAVEEALKTYGTDHVLGVRPFIIGDLREADSSRSRSATNTSSVRPIPLLSLSTLTSSSCRRPNSRNPSDNSNHRAPRPDRDRQCNGRDLGPRQATTDRDE